MCMAPHEKRRVVGLAKYKENISVHLQENMDYMKNTIHIGENFDIIYIDPPYFSGIYEDILCRLKKAEIKDTIIIVEHSEPLNFDGFKLIKEKNYGGKLASFLQV